MAKSKPVVFEVDGRLRDAWGTDHGDVPDPNDEAFMDEGAGPGTDVNGDGALNLDEMNGEQLKAELKRRREAGREIDTKGITTVGGLREVLKADDRAQVEEEQSGGAHSDSQE